MAVWLSDFGEFAAEFSSEVIRGCLAASQRCREAAKLQMPLGPALARTCSAPLPLVSGSRAGPRIVTAELPEAESHGPPKGPQGAPRPGVEESLASPPRSPRIAELEENALEVPRPPPQIV